MLMKSLWGISAAAVLASGGIAAGQSVLFDFNSTPQYSPFPIDINAGGVTAHCTGGYSIQQVGTVGISPAGFSGNCMFPNGVFGSDLTVGFSRMLTDFSVMYSPQELGCDDSARMRVTAYMNGTSVGTVTTTCPNPGTWPTGTLAISVPSGFNSVVVHYDLRPPTCQDYGVIFLADNMSVVLKATPACRADFNGSGSLSVQDIFDFLSAWFASDPRADFDGTSGLQVQDIFDFLAAWFAGCP